MNNDKASIVVFLENKSFLRRQISQTGNINDIKVSQIMETFKTLYSNLYE